MNHPDGELPENWQGKTKEAYNAASIRRLWLAVALLILLLGIGVSVGILRPDLLGSLFPNVAQTQTAEGLYVLQTQQALQATAQANAQNGTQAALNLQGTQAALDATQGALNQAGTQSALDAIAQRTATVQAIQQRATTNALDLQGTQAALNLAGTQAGLDVQSTLAELQGSNPTQAVGDPILSTPVPTTSASASAAIDDDFSEGISPGVWHFDGADWTAQGIGLVAGAPSSTLITRRSDFRAYSLDVWFRLSATSDQLTFSHVGADNRSWLVILRSNGNTITQAQLLANENTSTPIILSSASVTAGADIYHAHIEVSATQYIVSLNDQVLIDVPMNGITAGAVSITLPNGAYLSRVTVTPNDG